MGAFDGAATVLANFRQKNGSPTTWNGKTYYATVATLDMTTVPGVGQQGSENIEDADHRVFVYSPSVFAGGAKPDRLSVISWNGRDYIVSRAYPSQGGTSWKCEASHLPPPNSATANPDGTRPSFRPPDIPQT